MYALKRTKQLVVVCMAVTLLTLTLPALADNFAPPDYVGDPLSYHAEWEFTNGPIPPTPPAMLIPDGGESNGGPLTNEFLYDLLGGTHIDLDTNAWGWVVADGDGGMMHDGPDQVGQFVINTINWVDEMPEKYIRVQITYIGQAPTVLGAHGYSYNGYHPTYPGLPTETTYHGFFDAGPVVVVDDPNNSYLYQDIWMEPNPDWEQIVVDVPLGTIIDEIVVDSISIPEPATMSLLALGGLALLRRRRRL
jgi:hypothetical protein